MLPGFAEEILNNYDKIEYDSKKEKTFNVTITKIKEMDWTLPSGTTAGIYLTVTNKGKQYTVPVAPVWFITDKEEGSLQGRAGDCDN